MTAEPAEAVLAERLRYQAEACERLGSHLYAALLSRAAEDLEAHGPAWEVLRGHEGDPVGSALVLRLMGAVNRLALTGVEPALADIYAKPDSDPEAAWGEFRAVLERNAAELRQLIQLPVQTNEVGRSSALLLGFLTVAVETGLPLRLLEVGASAGLNLRWDSYRYRAGGFAWGPADSPLTIDFELLGGRFPSERQIRVNERLGCDASPLDPASPDDRVTLFAYIWPDRPERVERMRTALALAAGHPVSIDHESAAPWTERRLAEARPGEATVLYHSLVSQYLDEGELQAFQGHIEDASQRAHDEAPLAWLRMEYAGDRAELRLTTWPGGKDRLLARVGYHGTPVEVLTPAAQ